MVHLLCPRETQLIFKFWILRINCTFNYLTYYIINLSSSKLILYIYIYIHIYIYYLEKEALITD